MAAEQLIFLRFHGNNDIYEVMTATGRGLVLESMPFPIDDLNIYPTITYGGSFAS